MPHLRCLLLTGNCKLGAPFPDSIITISPPELSSALNLVAPWPFQLLPLLNVRPAPCHKLAHPHPQRPVGLDRDPASSWVSDAVSLFWASCGLWQTVASRVATVCDKKQHEFPRRPAEPLRRSSSLLLLCPSSARPLPVSIVTGGILPCRSPFSAVLMVRTPAPPPCRAASRVAL